MTRRIRPNHLDLVAHALASERALLHFRASLQALAREVDRSDPLAQHIDSTAARAEMLSCRVALLLGELELRP